MKSRPVGAELFHTDGGTDVTKAIVAFPQLCERACKTVHTTLFNILPPVSNSYTWDKFMFFTSSTYYTPDTVHIQKNQKLQRGFYTVVQYANFQPFGDGIIFLAHPVYKM